jgi:hydroxyethylthiazole kinase-like uncharacterized protein yjeF
MKIFDTPTIREIDKLTVQQQQITTDALMERAGTQIFNWIHYRMQGAPVKVHVFCGIGNNGGDGLVVARHLVEHGYNVQTYVVNYSDKRSKDFLINFDRIKDRKHWPELINSDAEFPEIGRDDIIIDAIFGIGLNRPPADWVTNLIKHLNGVGAFILSVDIPSGLYMNTVPENTEAIIKSNYTLTFEAPKLVFFLPQTGKYLQSWELIPIGWDVNVLMQADSGMYFMTMQDILPLYIPRERFSHKGNYGHALIIGGSYGKIGATVLATKGSFASGAGLVTTYIPKCGYNVLQTAVPEAMVQTSSDENYVVDISFNIQPSAIGFGVGIGTNAQTVEAFKEFLAKCKAPLVIDADGLNMLSENKELLKLLPENTVLTPHPKELERLVGRWKDDFDKLEKAKQFAKKYNCIINIKDTYSMVLHQDRIYVNSTGNPGMATAGSGDVLTGIITGLLAQGYEPLQATIFGNYIHGVAGDIGVEHTSYQSLTAGKLVDFIGVAFIDLFKREEPQQQEQQEEEPQQ